MPMSFCYSVSDVIIKLRPGYDVVDMLNAQPLLSLRISRELGESYGMEESATVNQMQLQQTL